MPAYTPAVTPIDIDKSYNNALAAFGGWDPMTKKLSRLNFVKMLSACDEGRVEAQNPAFYAMDTMALAIEAGALDENNFHEMLSGDDLDALCDKLRDELDIAWVNDRHFHALGTVLGHFEEQLYTYPSISEALRETFAG